MDLIFMEKKKKKPRIEIFCECTPGEPLFE